MGQANIVLSGERKAVRTGGVINRVPCHMAAHGGRKRVVLVLQLELDIQAMRWRGVPITATNPSRKH